MEPRRRLGRGEGGVQDRVDPFERAMASTPWSNSSRLGNLMGEGLAYELRRVKRGIGEHSREILEAVENDPVGTMLAVPSRSRW